MWMIAEQSIKGQQIIKHKRAGQTPGKNTKPYEQQQYGQMVVAAKHFLISDTTFIMLLCIFNATQNL